MCVMDELRFRSDGDGWALGSYLPTYLPIYLRTLAGRYRHRTGFHGFFFFLFSFSLAVWEEGVDRLRMDGGGWCGTTWHEGAVTVWPSKY